MTCEYLLHTWINLTLIFVTCMPLQHNCLFHLINLGKYKYKTNDTLTHTMLVTMLSLRNSSLGGGSGLK